MAREDESRRNQQSRPKRKLKFKLTPRETKQFFIGLAATLLVSGIGGAIIHNNREERELQGAQAYVNEISMLELRQIAKGYSPEQDEVISDMYEQQIRDGNKVIREIAGINTLYDRNKKAVTYEDYVEVADEFLAYVKDSVWDKVGQYYFKEEDRSKFCFYQNFNSAEGYTNCLAIDRYSHTANRLDNDLLPKEMHHVKKGTDLDELINTYIDVMRGIKDKDIDALRKYLGKGISRIEEFNERAYYINNKKQIQEVSLEDVQKRAVKEVQEGDYKVDSSGKVTLTDLER